VLSSEAAFDGREEDVTQSCFLIREKDTHPGPQHLKKRPEEKPIWDVRQAWRKIDREKSLLQLKPGQAGNKIGLGFNGSGSIKDYQAN